MGAWSEEPLGSDEAQEWIANSITQPMLDAILIAIDRFLSDKTDDVRKVEAEAAVALLIDLANREGRSKYVQFDPGCYMASQSGVWKKATEAIKLLMSQEKWLAQWNNPQKKMGVLMQLFTDLQEAMKDFASNES
jgi:3-hydroxy-3-methylglutaryl CoA synthase